MLRGPRVQDLLHTMLEHRARVKDLAETRTQALHTSLLMAGFTRAATQVRGPPYSQPTGIWATCYSSQMTFTFPGSFSPHHNLTMRTLRSGELNGFPRDHTEAQNI